MPSGLSNEVSATTGAPVGTAKLAKDPNGKDVMQIALAPPVDDLIDELLSHTTASYTLQDEGSDKFDLVVTVQVVPRAK